MRVRRPPIPLVSVPLLRSSAEQESGEGTWLTKSHLGEFQLVEIFN
jgi:hypothetical protein